MNSCVVLALKHDVHADAVVDRLHGRCSVLRIDPMSAAVPLHFEPKSLKCRFGNKSFFLTEISGIFCRIALEALNLHSIADPLQKFCASEYVAALTGILLNVPRHRWINFPFTESLVEGKIYPLLLAKSRGFNVPDFIVSSDIAVLREFAAEVGPCIIKPLSVASIAWQDGEFIEIPEMEEFAAPYTHEFDFGKLGDSPVDTGTPSLVQAKIEKRGDIRVVVVDNRVFATYLDATPGVTDSRLTLSRSERPHELRLDLCARLLDLIHNELGLRFAALDFIDGIDGHLHLVDINPSGNWLWQENECYLPISSTIANALV